MSRAGLVLSTLSLLACTSNTVPPRDPNAAPAEHFRADLLCTERPAGGERDCKAKGCRWGPMLSCHGTEPPPEELEAERQAYEDGSVTCDCICPEDEHWCSEVP